MPSGSVRVVGLNKTIRALQAAGAEIDDLKGVFSEIAALGADLAAKLAPKRTGRLAKSIRGNKAKNKAVISAGRKLVPYAGAINYGWPKRRIQPSYFMQRADSILAPHAVKLMTNGIDDIVKKVGLG